MHFGGGVGWGANLTFLGSPLCFKTWTVDWTRVDHYRFPKYPAATFGDRAGMIKKNSEIYF